MQTKHLLELNTSAYYNSPQISYRRNSMKMPKAVFNKPAVTILHSEKVESFSLRFVRRQRCTPSSLSVDILFKVLARAVRGKKGAKNTKIRKVKVKLCIFGPGGMA